MSVESADDFKSLLCAWGLSYLVDKFVDEGIDNNSFDLLDEATMKELIPKKGHYLLFKAKFNEYLSNKSMVLAPIVLEVESESSMMTSFLSLDSPSTSSNVSYTTQQIENLVENKENYLKTGSSNKRQSHNSLFLNYSTLEELLRSSTEGRILLSRKTKLNNDYRQKLVNIIINEIANECFISKRPLEVKSEKFIEISQAIEEIFPGEDRASYYIPYCAKDNQLRKQPARGKLWFRFSNIKAQLRLINKDKIKDPDETGRSFTKEESDNLSFLKSNDEPYPQILSAWEDTYDLRTSVYGDAEIEVIFNDFHFSKKDFFLNLLECDFNKANPDKIDIFYTDWAKIVNSILAELDARKIAVAESIHLTSLDSDTRALSHLAYLFSPSNVKGKNFHWRPTRAEVQDSIFCIVKDEQELEAKITKRRLFLDKGNLPLQPFAFCKTELEELQFFIYAFGNKYKVDVNKSARCIELLYKCYHALNLEYPSEGKQVWILIQELIFKTHSRIKNSTTSGVISDLKHRLNSL